MTENSETIVLDPTTMAKALTRLSAATGNGLPWQPTVDSHPSYPLQDRFLGWYYRNWKGVETLEGLKTEASTSADVLNKFLTDNGFEPMFRQLSPGGVGAAAILDMLVQWAVEASITSLTTYDSTLNRTQHSAFEIPRHGLEVFDVPGQSKPLVKLNTKEGGAVWLIMADRPQHGLDLVDLAVHSLANRTSADTQWISSVVVPMLEIDIKANLDWMLGVNAGDHIIDQAFQMFKLRMNQEGARVKVATGFATARGQRVATPLRFDSPFAGWFTQAGSEIPLAAFYASKDSWQSSGKSLQDM